MGLFDSTTTQTTMGSEDFRNPMVMEAIKKAMAIGNDGIGGSLLRLLKGQQRDLYGNQSEALRQSAVQRLHRGGAGMQMIEQILGGIDQRSNLGLGGSLSNLDFLNEKYKFQGLGLAGQLSKGLTRKYESTTKQTSPNTQWLTDLIKGGLAIALAPETGGASLLSAANGIYNNESPNPYTNVA